MKRVIGCFVLLGAMLIASPGFALDAYQDRRGIFAGVSLGAGAGLVGVDAPGDLTGLNDNRRLGLHLGAEVGGGVNKIITGSLEGNWWIRTVTIGERHLDHQHLSLMPTVRAFFLDSIYVGAGAGIAYAVFDTERDGREIFKYREMGLALGGKAGYEFWLNGTVAAGIEAGYTRHFYGNANFDVLSGMVTLRWY